MTISCRSSDLAFLLSDVASVSACEEGAHPTMVRSATAKYRRTAPPWKLFGFSPRCFMINSPLTFISYFGCYGSHCDRGRATPVAPHPTDAKPLSLNDNDTIVTGKIPPCKVGGGNYGGATLIQKIDSVATPRQCLWRCSGMLLRANSLEISRF